jgi:FKBP-type peptidyl-prolyl cis-trans isomerase
MPMLPADEAVNPSTKPIRILKKSLKHIKHNYNKMRRIIAPLVAATVLFASCNQYEKTPTGFLYKIKKGDSKETLKQGQFVKLNIEYKLPSKKDSILTSSYGKVPVYMIVDTSRMAKHSFLEVINKCAPGDKMEFAMSIDTLKKMGMLDYNNDFKAKEMINGKVDFLKTFATQELMMADYQKEMEIEKKREVKELKDFIAKKGYKTQESPNGVFVEIVTPGDAAAKADTGKQVSLRYRGTFLDGKEFDGNMGPKAQNTQPLTFVVGTNGIISGLSEGVRFFNKGGKGKIFVPAMLGYGPNGSAPVIPAYSPLIFEIEVLDVTAPTPAPSTPAAPKK